MLWRALPALEELQSAWEKRRSNPKYGLYHNALTDGLEKLRKYYSRLDEKPSFVLALGKTFILSLNQMTDKPFKYSIHITNWLILNWLGVDLRSKPRK